MSKAVPLMPSVMCLVAAPWIEQRGLGALTDLDDFFMWGNLNGRTYQMSDTWVKAGIATVLYSCEPLQSKYVLDMKKIL